MRVAFHTLGCKVNSYETQGIEEQFRALGFDIADFSEPADVYVINTCSVTQVAEHKSRQMINRAKKLNPGALVVATGCYAQVEALGVAAAAAVDLVGGTNGKSEIAGLVTERLKDTGSAGAGSGLSAAEAHQAESYVDDLTKCRDFESQSVTAPENNTRAYIKIQDGCDRFCSYCVIPYVRGRSRSRKEDEILDEVRGLAANGFKEVVLTGIDISTYRNEADQGHSPLAHLAEKVSGISGIERIRFGSLEVSTVTAEFAERLSKCPGFCPQFHLSLQSGADETLRRMNRKYTVQEYASKVDLLRKYFNNPGITTDIIAGFPGETEAEFEQTMEFVRKIRFSRIHVFKYSPRKGTRAEKMPDQIPAKIKNERSARLIGLGKELQEDYERSLQGTPVKVLLEENVKIKNPSAGEQDGGGTCIAYTGYTPVYVRIAVPDPCGKLSAGEIVEAVPAGFAELGGEKVLLAKFR